MRHATVVIGVVIATLLATSVLSENPGHASSRSLEQEISRLDQRVDALERELTRAQGLLEETVEYVRAQAKASKEMTDVLKKSEKAGFVFGMNPDSREILLKGWRDRIDSAQEDLPEAPKSPRATWR